MGLSGYYRKFIQNYVALARPLTDLLKKDSFLWTEAAQQAFNTLKHVMISTLVLVLHNFSKPFVLEIDASEITIGAVLSQDKHPIAYFKKKYLQECRIT